MPRPAYLALCGCRHFGREHFVLKLLHRAETEANHLGNFADADALGEFGSCLAQLLWIRALDDQDAR